MSQSVSGGVFVAGALAASALSCSKSEKATVPPASSVATVVASESAAPSDEPPKPKPKPKLLKCEDFFTVEETKKLGMFSPRYDPDKQQSSKMTGALCMTRPSSFVAYGGDRYRSLVGGSLDVAIKKGSVKKIDGPIIGGKTQWTLTKTIHTVAFQSKNEKFAATVAGGTKADVEKLAKALAAKMETM